MKRTLLVFLLGFILGGVAVAFIPIHYMIPTTAEYALERLKDAEGISREYFLHEELTARANAQAYYILHSYRAWKIGAISDSEYHRAQAIGHLRFCIVKEQQVKVELAGKICDIAKSNLEKWRPGMPFEEFREIVNKRDFMEYTLPNQPIESD